MITRAAGVVILCLLFILFCSSSPVLPAADSQPLSCELEAQEKWQNSQRTPLIQRGLISQSILNGWWSLAAEAIKFAQDEGLDVSTEVRSSIATVQREVAEIIKLLEQPNEMQTLSPALQWAESNDRLFIRIKFAYRWSSPGALVLEDQNVSLLKDRIFLSGVGTHSNIAKLYKLDIRLHSDIIPEDSEYNWGAVGQMLITLKKAKPEKWETLLHESEKKISNTQIWWEMKEKLEVEETDKKTPAAKNATDSPKAQETDGQREEL